MLQQRQVPTLKDLVNKLPPARDIPSLSKYQAKEALLKSRKLLNATMEAVKQLHHWSLSLNFEEMVAMEQSRLNNDIHNQQMHQLTEMLGKICDLNQEPFRAIFNRAGENSETIEFMAWHITDKMANMSRLRMISKLTTRVKNAVKKLDKQADKYNALSDQIFETSQMYHAASFALSSNGGPPPQWYIPGNQQNNPLNFSHPSLRNSGVVPLVTRDAVNPPNLEPAPELLQILPPPPTVEHPNDNNDNIGMND